MSRPTLRVLRSRWTPALAVAALALGIAGPASAAPADTGSIDHVDAKHGTVQVLYSVPGAGSEQPDLSSVSLSLDGTKLAATAEPASDSHITRTTILAIDTSNSMGGAKFAAAKRAAQLFLDSAPSDIEVGIVTFAGTVSVLQQPSLNRTAAHKIIDGLTLSFGTHLYDGLVQAVQTSGGSGPRSVLVLSDGRDTSSTPLGSATRAIKKQGIKVDVIALAQSQRDEALLTPLSKAGGGEVISAAHPKQLSHIFASEAQALAGQVLVTAKLAAGAKPDGTLTVGMDVGGTTYTDSAYVTLPVTHTTATTRPAGAGPLPVHEGFQVSSRAMVEGAVMLGVGLLIVLVALVGGFSKQPDSLESRIDPFTTRGASRQHAPQAQTVTAQAVEVAQKALEGGGFESTLGAKLDAGGMSLKPAEWLLLHAGIALAAGVLAFLLTGGNLLLVLLGLVAGVVLPWFYLGHKQSKRLKAFNSQLAGTLQLLAGSLQAGLSVAQGMDTIVREGAEPVAGEFRRALVETRLGVQIEDALESMAERMMSDDFRWTVMAIRIQREVGGNLAELMLTVAATLREREYLRRQVKSLSAEGRFSAYILLAMPPVILLYEYMTNRSYLQPLISSAMGFVLLGAMGLLMGVGAFAMQRIIKLEV